MLDFVLFLLGVLVVAALLFLVASLLLGRGETQPPADLDLLTVTDDVAEVVAAIQASDAGRARGDGGSVQAPVGPSDA